MQAIPCNQSTSTVIPPESLVQIWLTHALNLFSFLLLPPLISLQVCLLRSSEGQMERVPSKFFLGFLKKIILGEPSVWTLVVLFHFLHAVMLLHRPQVGWLVFLFNHPQSIGKNPTWSQLLPTEKAAGHAVSPTCYLPICWKQIQSPRSAEKADVPSGHSAQWDARWLCLLQTVELSGWAERCKVLRTIQKADTMCRLFLPYWSTRRPCSR